MSLSPELWREKGQVVPLLGYDIFIIDEGARGKDTLLLIHGFPTSSWDWGPIWNALKRDYRLVTLDLLGYGFSEKPPKHPYSIVEQADIVEALITHLGLNAFHVLAHDYGDTVAQELLARQNKGMSKGLWKSCCFLNGGLFPEQHRPRLVQKLLLTPFGPLINALMTKRRFSASISAVFGPTTQPSQGILEGFWELINFNKGKTAFPYLIQYIRDRHKYRDRWRSALKEALMPLGLINGSVDPVSGAHMVDYYLEHIGAPDYLARLENVGHYPQIEAPEEVVMHYRNFLTS